MLCTFLLAVVVWIKDFITILADGPCSLTSTRRFRSMRVLITSMHLLGRFCTPVGCRTASVSQVSSALDRLVSSAYLASLGPLSLLPSVLLSSSSKLGPRASTPIPSAQSPCRLSSPGIPSSVPASETPLWKY
jgi:hypothetical protein